MEYEAIFNNILFAAGCAFIILLIASKTYFDVGMVTPMKDLYYIESAHLTEYCFTGLSGSKDLITKEFLDEYNGKEFEEICQMEKPKMKIMVKDLQTNQPWYFDEPFSDYGHMIYVSLMYNENEIHPGGLYVEKF